MPSSVDPSVIQSGPGKIHVDVISAAADLFSSGSSEIVASIASVISQPFVQPSSSTFTASGVTGDATRLLTSANGPYYVGSATLGDLFRVASVTDDTEIFNRGTGLYVSVASINVAQSGFATSLTLTFNTPVPPSVQYRVYFGKRITVSNIPEAFGHFPIIRRSQDRVRFPEFDRTGVAPTSISPAQNYNVSADVPDPLLAQWKATLRGSNVTAINLPRGGAIGYAHLGTVVNALDGTGNDVFQDNLAGAAFFAAYTKDIRSSSFTTSPAGTALTKIDSTLPATTSSGNTITLNAADYFRVGTTSALRLGVDMLELTFTTGANAGRKMTVIPTAFNGASARVVTCHTLGGATAAFASDTVNVKWIRPNFFAGGGKTKFSATEFNFLGMGVLTPGCISTSPTGEEEHVPPFFSSGTLLTTRAGTNSWNIKAFTWGSYTESASAVADLGKKTVKGELRGDGSILSLGGHVEGLLTHRSVGTQTISATGSYTFNPFNGPQLRIDFSGSSTKILTLTLDAAYLADQKDGDQVCIFVHHLSSNSLNLLSTIVWPTQFTFSGPDGDIRPTAFSTTKLPMLKFTGVSLGGQFYMTRTDYEI